MRSARAYMLAPADVMLEGASTFWGQFLPNLVATLVGAFVGFLLALRVDHARELAVAWDRRRRFFALHETQQSTI